MATLLDAEGRPIVFHHQVYLKPNGKIVELTVRPYATASVVLGHELLFSRNTYRFHPESRLSHPETLLPTVRAAARMTVPERRKMYHERYTNGPASELVKAQIKAHKEEVAWMRARSTQSF